MMPSPGSAMRGSQSKVRRVCGNDKAGVLRKRISAAGRASLLLVLAGGMFLASCGSGGTPSPNISLPVVTVSPASASLPTGGLLQFTATVVSPTSTTLTWYVNNILGGNSTIGTINSTGLYSAPASVPNPSTVTIKATSSAETNPSGSAIVAITLPVVNATVTVAPTNLSMPAGTTAQFAATVTGTSNTAVTWSVNGVAGGNATVGTISTAGLYTAPAAVPSPPTVAVTATSQASTSQSASTTITLTASNSAPLFVNFGPNGNTGNANTAYYNGLFTSVKVCLQGTITCQTIPDILVDTGSVGLRVLNSQLTAIPASELGTIKDSTGNQLQECVQFGDTTYAWGPVLIADVAIAGERAASVPIQVIGDTSFPAPTNTCLSLGNGPSLDTVAALGANGILGVGNTVQDCGPNCAAGQTFSGYPYYVCPNNVCQPAAVPVVQQVANPVSFFTKDNNGVAIMLPSISAAGAPTLPYTTAAGTGTVSAGLLIFGIGTQTNNALGSATVYATDANGNFPRVVYNSVTYTSGGFLDTGSNALYVSDAHTLGIPNCTDNPYYCPTSTFSLSLTNYGANGTSGTVALSLANADTLFGNNPSYAAFNNLAGYSGTSLATDYFDLGLPFFFGRTVFVGIAGTTVPSGVSAPNGYFAY